ncbi:MULTISPECIES: hypothetical protein [Methanobacterium]|jgi:hypothetical protein|uniref:Uncharacterized protein n=1 Tax=Methanobacterium veterum TaxID=408577 RepID=A0A9E5DK90_9EURY|nr:MULTISPECIES: hypothetical protein [Methanobacterium]MCZ3364450.1 hypothetical protein [Methanobacterium veterum]MCZ3372202.1 hypothetical protein [Methanobacterium veterum]
MENHEEILDPGVYYEKLQGMYIEESDLNLSTDFEARTTLVKLNRLQSDVSKLKHSVSQDMRNIRNLYLDDSIIEKPKVLGIFGSGKKLSATEKRKKLEKERENNLTPYKEVIDMIDDYILQIEDLKKYIEDEVLETYSRIPKTIRKISKADLNK